MNEEETSKWIESLRSFIISEWDDKGIPPTIGANTKDIKKNFKKLREYDVHHKFLVSDDDGNKNVIKNYNKHASSINQFFPTMLKTRVQNGSIYDWFTDEYQHKFEKVILRILKRDSMYNWSKCVKDMRNSIMKELNSCHNKLNIMNAVSYTHLTLPTKA